MAAPPNEPPTDPSAEDRLTLDESLNRLLVLVLQSLTPAERVAFVLHDVFGVPFRTIAEIVGRSPDATRTLGRSARRQVHLRREGEAEPDRDGVVVHDFGRACAAGERRRLELLLHPDITVVIDGGGKVLASVDPIRGLGSAARSLIRLFANEPALVVSEQSINGRIGLVLRQGGEVVGVVSLNITSDLIRDVWIVANPDKLRQWNALSQSGRLPGHSE